MTLKAISWPNFIQSNIRHEELESGVKNKLIGEKDEIENRKRKIIRWRQGSFEGVGVLFRVVLVRNRTE